MKIAEILFLFHHIHHRDNVHEVHHCGGKHAEEINPKLNYTIEHCVCGKHRIDKNKAIGHSTGARLKTIEVIIKFTEKCPEGGWHVESGLIV